MAVKVSVLGLQEGRLREVLMDHAFRLKEKHMKTAGILPLLLLCGALPCAAAGLTRDDLSPAAKKLIPETEDVTVVVLKTGESQEGELVADTAEAVTMRITKGGVIRSATFPKDKVASCGPKDVSPAFAKAVMDIKIDPMKSIPKEDYAAAIRLFDEFLVRCPDRPEADEIRQRRTRFQAELDAVQSGMMKVDGRLLNETQVAIRQCADDTKTLTELRAKHPGIEQNGFGGDAEAKRQYNLTEERRKALVRQLPLLIKQSIAKHLAGKRFKPAGEEIDTFLKLWMNMVIPEESRAGGAAEGLMDLGFIYALEKQFMRAYIGAGRGVGKLPSKYLLPKDMEYIPGGYFLMGREDAKYGANDFPLHLVYVEPFLIDRYEVRNKDYNEFAAFVRRTGDASCEHPDSPPMKDHTSEGSKHPSFSGDSQPVVGIDWFDAYAYAKKNGKRLPTEAEWEKAARGMRMRKYPWGGAEPPGYAVNCPSGRGFLAAEMDRQNPPRKPEASVLVKMGLKDPPRIPATALPVETWPASELFPTLIQKAQEKGLFKWDKVGVSPYTIFHMAGNAAEWTADWYDAGYYSQSPMFSPKGAEKGQARVFRGGSYLSGDAELLTTWRGIGQGKQMSGVTDAGEPVIGFRCVMSIEAAEHDL